MVDRKFDIVDSMIQKLEKYADNLENIVQQRTAELMDEKQKTDMLLYRMLPPLVNGCVNDIARNCVATVTHPPSY